MRRFEEIFEAAAARKGGAEALRALIPQPKPAATLRAVADDRWLSEMTRRVFQAGFSWKVVDDKWPQFETAFWGFDLGRCALMSDDDLDTLVANPKIIRNAKKIQTVRDNAVFLRALAQEHGCVGGFFADWPRSDFIGLLQVMKKRGAYMSGATAQYFLRGMGVDGVAFTDHVVKALIREGVVDKTPSSQKDLKLCQAAFDAWLAQGASSLTEISRVLAFSVED